MGPTFNLCLAHCEQAVIDKTLEAWDAALSRVSEALLSNGPEARLRGKPIRPVFEVEPRNKD